MLVFPLGFDTSRVLTTNGLPLDPLQPPTITALGSTFYRVDVTDTMPDFEPLFPNFNIRFLAGYATVVLRVSGQNAEKYYVLVSNCSAASWWYRPCPSALATCSVLARVYPLFVK